MSEPTPISSPPLRSLAAWRADRSLSQRALADRAGVAMETVSNIERCVVTPKLAVAQRLARALGVSTDAIDWPTDEQVKRPESRTQAGRERYRTRRQQEAQEPAPEATKPARKARRTPARAPKP